LRLAELCLGLLCELIDVAENGSRKPDEGNVEGCIEGIPEATIIVAGMSAREVGCDVDISSRATAVSY
jgi:hypothetical protein